MYKKSRDSRRDSSDDDNYAEKLKYKLMSMINEHRYSRDYVCNADETVEFPVSCREVSLQDSKLVKSDVW